MFCYWCKIHIIIIIFTGDRCNNQKGVREKEFSLVSIFSLNAAVVEKKKALERNVTSLQALMTKFLNLFYSQVILVN